MADRHAINARTEQIVAETGILWALARDQAVAELGGGDILPDPSEFTVGVLGASPDPEMVRYLMAQHDLTWSQAWKLSQREFDDDDIVIVRQNKARAWRWVAGVALSIVILFLSSSWWVVASLSSNTSQAEQNGAGWGILIGAVFVFCPAVVVLVVGLFNVAITSPSKTERIVSGVAAAAVLVAIILVVVAVITG